MDKMKNVGEVSFRTKAGFMMIFISTKLEKKKKSLGGVLKQFAFFLVNRAQVKFTSGSKSKPLNLANNNPFEELYWLQDARDVLNAETWSHLLKNKT